MKTVQRMQRRRCGAKVIPAQSKRRMRGRFFAKDRAVIQVPRATGVTMHFERGSRVRHPGQVGVAIGYTGAASTLGTSAGTITATAAVDATTLTTSGTLNTGWHYLGNEILAHSGDASTSDAGGELVYVSSVNGTAATLSTPILGGYSSGTALIRITRNVGSGVVVSGLRTFGKAATSNAGLSIGLVYNFAVRGTRIQDALNQSIYLTKCRRGWLMRLWHKGIGFATGNGYGTNPNQCQDLFIRDMMAVKSRHLISLAKDCVLVDVNTGFAFGGASVSGTTYTEGDIKFGGFDDHDGSRRVKVRGIHTDYKIALGNSSWGRRKLGYDLADCSCEFLYIHGSLEDSTIDVEATAFHFSGSGSSASWSTANNGIVNVVVNGRLIGASTNILARTIDLAANATAGKIQELCFDETVVHGVGAAATLRIDNNLAAGDYAVGFKNCTDLRSGTGAGSRFLQIRGSTGTVSSEIRFEFLNSEVWQLAGTATTMAISYVTTSGGVKFAETNSTVKIGANAPVAMTTTYFINSGTGSVAWTDSGDSQLASP